MAERMTATSYLPLDGRASGSAHVSITPADPASRLALRAGPAAIASLSRALGVKLPISPKTSSRGRSAKLSERVAMWLGPDEWLVLDQEDSDLTACCRKVKAAHSAVDVSCRNTAILVSGPGARAVLGAGCPQNLSEEIFAVGACSRTVMGKAEVVIWRSGKELFRVECWRSFSDYVFTYLAEAARDPSL